MPDPNLPPPDAGNFINPDPNAPPDKVREAMDALGNPSYTTPPKLPVIPAQPALLDPELPGLLSALPSDYESPPLWARLPGFSIGWDDNRGDDFGWHLGPIFINLTSGGCSWQMVGCAGLLVVVLLTTGLCTFHLGPFEESHQTIGNVSNPTATAAATSGHCTGSSRVIFDGFFPDVAMSPGATPPNFDTNTLAGGSGKRYCLVHLATYHWNNGGGAPGGGKLSLVDLSRHKTLGPWDAKATPATAGVLANWEADISTSPEPVVLNGTYTVGDSGPATWSWSNASQGKGFFRLWAEDFVSG